MATKTHGSLTDTDGLHLPKDFSAASNSTAIVKDSSGSLDYQPTKKTLKIYKSETISSPSFPIQNDYILSIDGTNTGESYEINDFTNNKEYSIEITVKCRVTQDRTTMDNVTHGVFTASFGILYIEDDIIFNEPMIHENVFDESISVAITDENTFIRVTGSTDIADTSYSDDIIISWEAFVEITEV
jgi:PDZ domain-containing secreted protein